MKGYYNSTQTAEILGISPTTLYNWKINKRFVPDLITPSNRTYYEINRVHEYFESFKVENKQG